MKINNTIIIGAGLAGLTLAKKLKHALIVDKARGVGGRIASRRFGATYFNQGVPYLPFSSKNKVNDYAKEQSKGLRIINQFRVHRIYRENDIYNLLCENGRMLKTRKIIFTAPAPQVKEILDRSQIVANFLDGAQYETNIKVLCKNVKNIDLELNLDETKIIGNDTYQMYSSKKYDKQSISTLKIEAEDSYIHFWRYSQVKRAIDPKYQLALSDQNIFFAGDYFGLTGLSATLESVKILEGQL